MNFCSHMKKIRNVNNYWTKERCQEESSKYNNLKDFRKFCKTGYRTVHDNNWYDVCSHMKIMKRNYWTKEKCKEVASTCETKSEFKKKYARAYNISRKNNWLNEFCSHMKIIGNKMFRCIYSIEFSDNNIYVGLTFNINSRFIKHLKSGLFINIY